ncbi:MAG: DNA primase [Actinobacteria bacterium]|nr:DNA primase [Actinomycetota bacterium]MBL7061008.1 DNA primase [Actinomycetota bacterium]
MARSLKEGEVNELKSRISIQDIVSNYVNLKKTGKSYVGLCPFHKEKTPSFTVDSIKQLYHCFGCGEGGDVISFIMKIENMEFVEAVEFLAKKVGYSLKYVHSRSSESGRFRNRLIDLNELAKKYYNFILFNRKVAGATLDYLKNRGFKEKTLKEFEVGFSIDSWDSFSEFAKKKGYGSKEILESGLAIKSRKSGQEVYDRFRGRIMFPIKDIAGKTIGFGGRIINSDDKDGKQAAKYINTPETKLYLKSKNIYGIFKAKNYIIENDEVFIVEGYTDVMALNQFGIKNVVASLGTALTSDQIKLIGRFTKNIVLVFDSDKAGMNASLRGIERLKEYNERLDLYHESNIDIRVAILEKGYDPADFIIKKGRDDFLRKIKSAIGIIDFTIDVTLEKYDISNFNEKMKASDKLLRFILTLSSRMIQEECIKKIAEKLNLNENLLLEEMLKKSSKYADSIISGTERESISPLKNIEIEALKLMVNGIGDSVSGLIELGPEHFRFEDTRELFVLLKKEIEEVESKEKKINFPIEISSVDIGTDEVKKLYNYIIFSKLRYKDEDLICNEVLSNLKRIFISGKIEEIRNKMIELENTQKKIRLSIEKTKIGNTEEKEIEDKIDELNYEINELEKEKRKLIIT